jgi:glutathione S-transferase
MKPHMFKIGHPEKLPPAQTRYGNEIKHVVGMLGLVLANRTWLVGEKCTYADLAFVIWNRSIDYAMEGGRWYGVSMSFPISSGRKRCWDRGSVKKAACVMADKELRSKGRV